MLVDFEITGLKGKLVLLPGTIAELFRYLTDFASLKPEVEDSKFLKDISSKNEVKNYLEAYEKSPNSEGFEKAYRKLFQTHPYLRIIQDHQYTNVTLERLRLVLQNSISFTDLVDDDVSDTIDQNIYRYVWEKLLEVRPDRPIFNNKVDALNYAFTAGFSQKNSKSKYLALITSSERPYRVFYATPWLDDPIIGHASVATLDSTYNFSLVRSSAYAVYRIFSESHSNREGIEIIDFVSEVRSAIFNVQQKLSKLPEFTTSIKMARKSKPSITRFADVAKIGRPVVKSILDLEDKYFVNFINLVSEVLSTDRINELNQKVYKEIYENLRDPSQLVESIRFSLTKISDSYEKMEKELIEQHKKGFKKSMETLGLPMSPRKISSKLSSRNIKEGFKILQNRSGKNVLYVEEWESCFSLYWPCSNDYYSFVSLVGDLVQVFRGKNFLDKIPKLPNKKLDPSISLRTITGEE